MMCVCQRNIRKEDAREILKTIGYVISLSKDYFRVKDVTNMLGIKPKGRHKISHSLKTLASHRLTEIYHKNSRNLYYIPVQKDLQDAYYDYLWNRTETRTEVSSLLAGIRKEGAVCQDQCQSDLFR